MPQRPLHNPARFVPTYALGFAADGEGIETVSPHLPLPVTLAFSPSDVPPVSGFVTSDGEAGPLAPNSGRAVILVLSGEWQGTVEVLRSIDGGETRHPLTVAGKSWGRFSANACEPIWEETDPAATLWLRFTIAAGTLDYRMGH